MKKNIILFVKYPEKNRVKTRLAVSIDKDFVVKLYKCFVSDILDTLKKINANVFIFFQPDVSRHKMASWIGNTYPLFEQIGEDLGERICHAFCSIFEMGHDECIIIGSDSPDVPVFAFEDAFDKLQKTDIVIGPATDGGYYLLGLHKKTFHKTLFQNISWSSEFVYAQTIEKAKQLKYNIYQLPQWEDVDIPENLVHLYHRNLNTPFHNSATMKLLDKNLEGFRNPSKFG